MSNPVTLKTNKHYKLPAAQTADLLGRVKGLFARVPVNTVATGNAQCKATPKKSAPLADWWK
jgi:hypothetical protein